MDLSREDRIWNRAALQELGEDSGEGDRALAVLLLAHGLVMNGGVLHAGEVLSAAELAAAWDAFRLYGLSAAAGTLRRAAAAADTNADMDELEAALDEEYYEAIPDDRAIEIAFKVHLLEHAGAYAPLAAADSD